MRLLAVIACAGLSTVQAASTVTVRPGDTLFRLATRHHLSVTRLKTLNHLHSDTIRVGQRLTVAAPLAAHKAAATPPARRTREIRLVYRYVTVLSGQTIGTLARTYHTTPAVLARLNGQRRPVAWPGMRLLVPSHVAVPIPPTARRPAATLVRTTVLGIPVKLVRVDLRHRDVLVSVVLPGAGRSATVAQLARRSGARALINGSYFHPQTFAPAGDLVVGGRMVSWGRIPAALAITPDNRASIQHSGATLVSGRSVRAASAVLAAGQLRRLNAAWPGMETVVASGPSIVRAGRLNLSFADVFQEAGGIFRRSERSAVGLIGERDLIFVTTSRQLTASEMGKLMLRLGSRDALLLDGGSSSALAWNGQPQMGQNRKVAYGIGVFVNYTGRRYAR
ncbi:phosphodiester glycosidase family protein [Deinococcus sonorensis]|uniref:Phosphodiester glycosidase family protein n=2 Tax=Deinococcus sonorensis TaxID=309891 RepID=A0AAU7U9C2_9DEIO